MRFWIVPMTLVFTAYCKEISLDSDQDLRKVPVSFGDFNRDSNYANLLPSSAELFKRAPWYQSVFVKAPLSLIAGVFITDSGIYARAQEQCQEFKNNKQISTGADCIKGWAWSAMTLASHSASAYVGVTALFAGAGKSAIVQAFNAAGEYVSGHPIRDSVPQAFDNNQIQQLQSNLSESLANFTLKQVIQGDTEINDAWGLHFHHDTGMYQHVTNGTHGYVRVRPHTGNSTMGKRGDTYSYSFGKGVAGIKLSYANPCNHEVLDNSKRGNRLLYGLVGDLTQWMDKNRSDKYILEMFESYLKNDILRATLIFEQDGFGTQYEGWPWTPYMGCHSKGLSPYTSTNGDDRDL